MYGFKKRKDAVKKYADVIYALCPDKIQVNDIVLTAQCGGVSELVRYLTNSDYSHASLCTRPGMLIEAVQVGVLRSSVIETFAERKEWIKVLRPKTVLKENKDGYTVSYYAEKNYGHSYALKGAIGSRFDKIHLNSEKGIFCSQLIAKAYKEYGLDLLPSTPHAKVYPALLLKSEELIDVSEVCIRKIDLNSSPMVHHIATASSEIVFNEVEIKMNRRILKDIKRRLNRKIPANINSLSEVFMWLAVCTDIQGVFDYEIGNALSAGGYFKWYEALFADMKRSVRELGSATNYINELVDNGHSPEIMNDAYALLPSLKEAMISSEESINSRKSYCEHLVAVYSKKPIHVFKTLNNLHSNEYDIYLDLHNEKANLIKALERVVA